METKLLIYHHSKFPPRHINGEGLGLAKTMIGVEKLPWICYFWPGRGKLDSPTQQHGLPKALPNGRIGISPHNYLWEYKWWPPLVLQCKGHIMDSKDGWMDGWDSSFSYLHHPLLSEDHGNGEHLSHPPTRKPFFVGNCHKSLDGGWKCVMESVQFLWLESIHSSCMYFIVGLLKDLWYWKTYGNGCNMKLR